MSASQKHETKLSSLEKEQPGPSYLHLVKLFVKLAVGLFLFGVFAAEKICCKTKKDDGHGNICFEGCRPC